MPEAWNSSGGSPGWGIDVSTASEQPGPGLPEEPAESREPGDAPAEEVATAAAAADGDGAGSDLPELNDLNGLTDLPDLTERSGLGDTPGEHASDASDGPETEDERVARERVEFDKLVAAFHGESAPDPQPQGPQGPQTPAPRKIVRYPVLDPRPEWHPEIVEPTDETTVDPLDHVEHYEPPDPPLPQVGAATLASWTMLVGGVGFLVLHTLLKWQTPDYFGWLAIIGVFGGIISLVARMKPDRDEYDDPDNGAVV
jgi:hypothetical protein